MGNYGFSRIERLFPVLDSAWGTAVTATGGDYCRHTKCSLKGQVDLVAANYKTGTLTTQPGQPGRRIGEWSVEMPLFPGSAAGSAPDMDVFLAAAFGQAALLQTAGTATVTGATNASPIVITAVAHAMNSGEVVSIASVGGNTAANGTWTITKITNDTFSLNGSSGSGAYTSGGTVTRVAAVVYSLSDGAPPSFSLWRFRQPSSLMQQVAVGCVVKKITFQLGQDAATVSMSGPCLFVSDSINWSALDSQAKGGLSGSFPSEPSSPVANGNFITGYKGQAALDSLVIAGIRNSTVEFDTGIDLPRDWFGTDYVGTPERDIRTVTTQAALYEDDSTDTQDLITKALTKAGIPISYQIGGTAGSRYTVHLKGVQLASPELDDSQRKWSLNYPSSQAHGTSLTALDEIQLVVS